MVRHLAMWFVVKTVARCLGLRVARPLMSFPLRNLKTTLITDQDRIAAWELTGVASLRLT